MDISSAPLASPTYLRTHWWVPLVRGLLAIVFGIVLFALPITAVSTFVIIFGAFAFADGAMTIVQALRFAQPGSGRWWVTIAQGAVGIVIGVIAFVYPGLTATTLGLLIALWAVVTGIFEISTAIRLRRSLPNELFLIIAGVLSVAVGLLLAVFPLGAVIGAIYLIAIYAFVSGFALIGLAFRLRRS